MALERVAVIGAGAWGTALAQAAAIAGRSVTLVGRDPAVLGWAGSHDVIGHLHRHGINARHVELEAKGGVGRTILEYCQERDPDMLVMGAFGRGKLGALLFGGVSQYILEHQTLPVFMSP